MSSMVGSVLLMKLLLPRSSASARRMGKFADKRETGMLASS